MRTWLAVSLFTICALCAPVRVHGQAQPINVNKGKELHPDLYNPSIESAISSPAPQLNFEGSKDNGRVTGRIGLSHGAWSADVILSSPIGAKATEATLVDLNGLANSGTFDFGVKWTKWNPHGDPILQKQACIEYLIDSKRAKDPKDAEAMMRTSPDGTAPKFVCALSALPEGTPDRPDDSSYREKFNSVTDYGTPLFLESRFKVGREEFKFAESPAFLDKKQVRNGYSGSLAFGALLEQSILLSAGYRYEQSFTAAAESQVCSPLEESTSLRCRGIGLGPPTKKVQSITEFQLRRLWTEFGLNPKIAYDFRKEVFAVQVPIYFFKNKDQGLNGGVSFGWRSDADEFVVRAFIGEALTLISK